jgi:hypothetical protein
MKLADVELSVLRAALNYEETWWTNRHTEEKRQVYEAELVTICLLRSLRRALEQVEDYQSKHGTIPR